jgi:dynein heavy chain
MSKKLSATMSDNGTKNGHSSRRAEMKKKLKSIEWTDDDIEEISSSVPVSTKPTRITATAPVKDDMDAKIERVQQRKKEAEERSIKHSKKNIIKEESSLLNYININDEEAFNLSTCLNDYFIDLITGNPYLVNENESKFPLNLFDSSEFNDLLPINSTLLPMQGSCLISSQQPQNSPRDRGLGRWYACSIIDAIENIVTVKVIDDSSSIITDLKLPRICVCLLNQKISNYGDRVAAALQRRADCVSLLKYNYFIQQMPYHVSVTSTLKQAQQERIHNKSHSMERLHEVDPSVFDSVIDEARGEYELMMNKIMFDANMLSSTNKAMLEEMRLPATVYSIDKPIPQSGIIDVPVHSMLTKINHFQTHSYLCSAAALISLENSVRENNLIKNYTIIDPIYSKTLTLERYERWMADQMMLATRSIRQEWAARSGSEVKEPLVADLEAVPQTSGVKLDINIKNVHNYDATENPIKSFLERINYMMGDVLKDILRRSVFHFSDIMQQLCSCIITVNSVRDIKVEFPPNSIYKSKVLPPLFSVSFRVSSESRVLNQKSIDDNLQELEDWKKSEDAKAGEKCTIKTVAPIIGKSVEYTSPIETLKKAVLRVFDEMLTEFVDVPHVQKYVVDKIYFPNPRYIPSINEDDEIVKNERKQVSIAMDKALAPLTKYLEFFSKFEDFINIDNKSYVESKIIIRRREEDSQEIEIPVSLNLPQVLAVLNDHYTQIEDIETSLPTTPISCGMFLVEVISVRNLLLAKHKTIVGLILSAHAEYCQEIAIYLEEEFKKITKALSKRPDNVEQLTELEDYVGGLGNTMSVLQSCISEMLDYDKLLEKFKFKTEFDYGQNKWNVFGAPAKVATKCAEVTESNNVIKRRFKEDMDAEQDVFTKSVDELETQVTELAAFNDLSDVTNIAAKVEEVGAKLKVASEKAKLFNSRESLFDAEVTDYEDLARVQRSYEPFFNLWQTALEWTNISKTWINSQFVDLDSEEIERSVDKFYTLIGKASKFFLKNDMAEQASIAKQIQQQVNDFRPEVPMIVTLRNPGMRDRHWVKIADLLGVDIMPIENFTTEEIIGLNLKNSLDVIQKIGESAAKEYQIEMALDKMEKEWESQTIQIHPYKETGTGVIRGIDDVNGILDEHITMTQTIMFSAFKGPFEQRIEEWNRKLCTVSDVLEVWVAVQRSWLYLQPIFESADINRQLPAEGKKFSLVDKNWRQTIAQAKNNQPVVEFCDNEKLLEKFKESEILLDQVQKGLSDYLETKRSVFARFYFLSNDELLSILSESKDVKLVQPHLKKCFEGIDKVKFMDDLKIDRIISPEGEEIMLSTLIDPVEVGVEHWMLELEALMRTSVQRVMTEAIFEYTEIPRPKWMQKYPGMCVLNGSQLHWTTEMEELFASDGIKGPVIFLERQILQLVDMTVLVRGKLSSASRTTVGALTVIDVHARDVIIKLIEEQVDTKDNFGWNSQLRYYFDASTNDLSAQMVAATRPYGYEYLGNSFRLVITPLTDKCYLTLMGALQMIFGGAPAGPAGTGKTETTKDLAKALAMQCVVFNCSDGLDFVAMGKFFKGLAACGAWACFDEFNRINIEVLSVIGQQIMSIQMAVKNKEPRMVFEGSDIAVSDRFAVFITMNPGYAGRSALPDSLQALFRPVAMMVPDYALIGEIMFFAYGFELSKQAGAKMVTTFKLCSEQLSSQPHYDYGMRAVKTVITAAGNLKRAEPDADEMILLLRALQDVNIPKFLEMDLPLFEGIISDLFPGKVRPVLDYGDLMRTMKDQIEVFKLQPVKFFITKVIQLYEMIVVRHGLMVVGPTGGGKSMNIHVLKETLGSLKDQGKTGFAYEKVKIFQLNPKSITMGQMYGEFDPNTLEWRDGIMSTMYRNATVEGSDRKWMLFDGPVDAIWIENMNTVLDDNKKLCLNSGEIIKMSNEMTMMFEVEDLVVASPATVSRVGIIYMEPKGLGLDPLIQSWLEKLPEYMPTLLTMKLSYLIDMYLPPAIVFLRSHLTELAGTVDNNLCESLLRILDCYLEPYLLKEGEPAPTDIMISDLTTCIEPLFVIALVWSVGATCNEDGRKMFDGWLRSELISNKFAWMMPRDGLVYDFIFIVETKKWAKWMDIIEKYEPDGKLSFSEIIVPTSDSVRNTYLLDLLLPCNKHIIMVGATGTGKTININQYLMGHSTVQGRSILPNVMPLNLTFSANTSANMTQDLLDSKMDKRRKGVYGPAAGKQFYVYVDDLNMPKRETYGAQPPIEILRQWFDQGGWYDRKDLIFRKIIDLTFVCSMGPPGGGKQMITDRFLRHFNMIGYVEMSDNSQTLIFSSILNTHLLNFEGGLTDMTDMIVAASIDIFKTVARDLLPTPSKSHYTFNLRDLAKVFQGMLMVDPKKMNSKEQLTRLWIHENKRVFSDRFTTVDDADWLMNVIRGKVTNEFKQDIDKIWDQDRIIFGDFINPEIEPHNRLYEQIESIEVLKTVVEEYLLDHNSESKQPMPLVMFSDALEHIARIARILRQPGGNALLLGVGGSGRQSMTKMATFIVGYELSTVEIVKGYSMLDWRENIKKILLLAGVKEKQTTFLFSDVQIIDERMVEDINNILNSGDVPNLYAAEDLEAISTACKIECQKRKIPATKLNIFAQYLTRVRKNIHLCVAMSPIGEAFRNRLRNYPSLVNCCTIDWFTNWPAEALQSVGLSILQSNNLGLGDMELATVNMFKTIHVSVETKTIEFYEMLRRKNYVTPTSYLELLSSFSKLIRVRRVEVATKKDRLQIGLNKLMETKDMVGVMQEELVVLQPILVKTQAEVADMMIEITKDKASAAETKAKVEIEESAANIKAAEAKEIADDAQRDLAEAIPALEEAVKCLNDLKKSDIDEVKSLKTPPGGVVLVLQVCCLMFNVKPIKKNDPNKPGSKFDDYFDAGKSALLSDSKLFIEKLINFDKDNIPDKTIKNIAPFMDDPNFTPAAIERASKACTAICMWARAMYKYHFVALGVAPKRAKLAGAQEELAIVMEKLGIAKATLQAVNERLAVLEASFNEAVEKKEGLEKKEASCKIQLVNADKLVGGLGGEETRWKESVVTLTSSFENILGDVLVSAGTISYLGVFTTEFRDHLVKDWQRALTDLKIPHTPGCNLESTLADPVKVRSWQLCALPSDTLSTQNGIIMDNGRRWPLLIDPQGQANRYIRTMSKNKEFAPNGMDVVKLTDRNFLRTLENGVQFGRWVLLENILEVLDAALEPILLQQKFKQGGQEMMKVGDNVIPYNDTFRFFMTTKLSNPHYAPEVQVKVSLLNFTITLGGLEEQLLGVVVTEELPELAHQKANLVVQNAASNKQLYDIESEILFLLSNSTGNILDDTVLIETLAQSKITSEGVKEKMAEAVIIEEEIIVQSELYRPVAKRSSLLYFVIADLGEVDPMYQYSLPWFTSLFIRGINNATPSSNMDTRVINLNDYFTYSVYSNICRSLFERHKLLFSFTLCIKILQGENKVDPTEYRFLLSGISPKNNEGPMPESSWLKDNVWLDLCQMSGMDAFEKLPTTFGPKLEEWQQVFDSPEPHRMTFPAPFEGITHLQKLCILRCLRRDKIELMMQDYVSEFFGARFVQPPPFDLAACYNDSTVDSPLIFILTSGSDPAKELEILAENMGFTDRLKRIALGQGQGKKASNLVEKGIQNGDWVMLSNCHLSISWMPTLEQICEAFEPDKIHPDFRLWLTSMPSESFPAAVLQKGVKITKEPPKGLRANLKQTYMKLDNEKMFKTNKPREYQKLLFGLSFFHALVVERKKFGPLGWNIPYEFNDTDMDITAAQLELYVEQYSVIPYKVLQQLASVVNYGGRITDDKDMRTSDIIIADFFNPKILDDEYKFSKSGLYYSVPPDDVAPHNTYMDYIEQFPNSAEPEVFGMHDNANITCAITDADNSFEIILTLQPRVAAGAGLSREDQIIEMCKSMHEQLPAEYDIEEIGMRYPTDYHQSLNTVLVQESQRYNALLSKMHATLYEIQRALKGLVVLSADLEAMGDSCFNQWVPTVWANVGYISLKPLGPWFKDLLVRILFMTQWIDNGVPASFWISGFFFPQGFLTSINQNYARKYQYPIDTVSFSFLMKQESIEDLPRPEDGVFVFGLFLEGARWDKENKTLIDPKPKELFSEMPVIHFLPMQYREHPQSGIYRCPVYKVLTRTGVLSTTGHSTNFVSWIEIPSTMTPIFRSSLVSETNAQIKFCDVDYWIKAGVACFCALRY